MEHRIITTKDVQDKMIVVHGKQVLLDRDVAALYGVETKHVNQAVRNNPTKFPEGYIIELDEEDSSVLRSKLLTLEPGKGRHSKYNIKAFTERGLYMLATILKSKRAEQTTIAIIDTFAQVREMARAMEAGSQSADIEKKKSLLGYSGEILANIVGENLPTTSVETEIELNLALVKIKHKVIRKEKED